MWWQLLVLQVGFFLLLLLALKKLFHGHLLSAIARMEHLQQQNIRKEQDLRQKQDTVNKECQEMLKRVEAQIVEKRARAELEYGDLKQTMVEAAREEEKKILIQAEEHKKILDTRFERETKQQGALIAVEIMKKGLSEKILNLIHQELTDELLGSLKEVCAGRDISAKKLQGVISIKTAFSLSEAQKNKLKKELSALLHGGEALEIQEKVDEDLVAGFVLVLDQLVMDGSLKSRFGKGIEIT